MGVIGRILGAGRAAGQVGAAIGGVAEVFVGNRAARDAAGHEAFMAALGSFGEEFRHRGAGRFDGFVNGLNRLPRPLLALGTLGLFVYAMAEPAGFTQRMQGLAHVPDPLWWLLGAVVSFYFGARELHHFRRNAGPLPFLPLLGQPADGEAAPAVPPAPAPAAGLAPMAAPSGPAPRPRPADLAPTVAARAADPHFNAAIEEWRRGQP
jgi:Holin of 3TMs, for gene-transfer release